MYLHYTSIRTYQLTKSFAETQEKDSKSLVIRKLGCICDSMAWYLFARNTADDSSPPSRIRMPV